MSIPDDVTCLWDLDQWLGECGLDDVELTFEIKGRLIKTTGRQAWLALKLAGITDMQEIANITFIPTQQR